MTPQEETLFRVLRILESRPDITQRELASRIKLSIGKTNYLLKALIGKGAVKIDNFKKSDAKLRKLIYLLTPAGLSLRLHLTQDYLARMEIQYEALKVEIEALKSETVRYYHTDGSSEYRGSAPGAPRQRRAAGG